MDPDRDGSPEAGQGSADRAPVPSEPTLPHEYGYGSTQPRTTSSAASADPPSSPAPPAPSGSSPSATPVSPPTAGDPSDPADPTQITSVTGVRGTTAPRAVLRPVPEGFPTPPPRPARPNRRPAAASPAAATAAPPRRGLLIAALAAVAVLILAVGVGGSILAYRALSSPGDGAVADPTTDSGGQDSGDLVLGAITVREVSTEVGVTSVGGAGSGIEPEGEFVVVTFEVVNSSSAPVTLTNAIDLTTTEGESLPPDVEATNAYIGDSRGYGVVSESQSDTFHAVYDVPLGSTPQSLHVDFGSHPDGGSGDLELSP